jgi:hypothetical protein
VEDLQAMARVVLALVDIDLGAVAAPPLVATPGVAVNNLLRPFVRTPTHDLIAP